MGSCSPICMTKGMTWGDPFSAGTCTPASLDAVHLTHGGYVGRSSGMRKRPGGYQRQLGYNFPLSLYSMHVDCHVLRDCSQSGNYECPTHTEKFLCAGWDYLASACADVLMHQGTLPPLTLGIHGKWGAGDAPLHGLWLTMHTAHLQQKCNRYRQCMRAVACREVNLHAAPAKAHDAACSMSASSRRES